MFGFPRFLSSLTNGMQIVALDSPLVNFPGKSGARTHRTPKDSRNRHARLGFARSAFGP
jgi:hypothetical protein